MTVENPNSGNGETPNNEDNKNQLDEIAQKLETLSKENNDLKNHIKTLNEENKNRRLSEKELKQFFASTLGLSETEKPEAEQIKEQLLTLNNSVKDLKSELEVEKQEKVTLLKEAKLKELANKLNFNDPQDIRAFVDINSENLEENLKELAKNKPYLLKSKPDISGTNPPNHNNVPNDIDQQIAEAIKKGDVAKSIALKNLKFGL